MKIILQRVIKSSVKVDDVIIGKIGRGMCVLLGIEKDDTEKDIDYLVSRLIKVKLWEDEKGNSWKLDINDIKGSIMIISQFTLYAIIGKKGRAPDFHKAMKACEAKFLYELFLIKLKENFKGYIATGKFQTKMLIEIFNDGPVTIQINSKK